MTASEDLRSDLHDIAARIDVGDTDAARSEIGAVVRRHRRRRIAAGTAGVLVVAIAGISAIAWAGRSPTPSVLIGVDPSTPAPATTEDATTEGATTTLPTTTVQTTPPTAPATSSAEPRSVVPTAAIGVAVDAPPLASQDMSAFVGPWRDGFLAIGDAADGLEVSARFSSDGIEWQPIEFTPPDGLRQGTYTTGGDRLVVVERAGTRSTITVHHTADLVTWTTQTIEPIPPPIELPAFVKTTLRPWSIVANDDGWIVEASQGVRLDAREILSDEDLADIDPRTLLPVDTDESGVLVTLDPGGPPLRYSWEELDVDTEQYEYIAQGINENRAWWSATWDASPAPTSHGGVPTSAGFVSVGSTTLFSADGATWTPVSSLPLSDSLPATLPYGDGIIVVATGDAPTVLRLDARGALIEEIVIEGLPPVQGPYSLPWAPTGALVYSSTAVPQPLQVLENEVFRLTYDPATTTLELVDVATGQVVIAENRDSFEATGASSLTWNEDGSITISDPVSGEAMVEFPSELVQQSMQDISDTMGQFVADLRLLATADGEEFAIADLPDDESSDGGRYQTVVNGTTALVAINDAWTRYELP